MKNILNISSFLIASFWLLSCRNSKKEAETTIEVKDSTVMHTDVTLTNDQFKVAAVELGKIEMRNLSSVIKVNGLLDVPPQNAVSVSAPLGGYVRSSGLLPGQTVRKGQVIAVIENPEFINIQQEYLESKSRLEFLSLEYKRQEELRKEDVNAAKTFQQVSSEYNMMQAKVAALRQKLALIGLNSNSVSVGNISRTANLYSPISGYVAESKVNRGMYVNPSDVLFELANKNDIHLALDVFEKDIRKINVGQPIRFSLANETNYIREAKVFLIGKSTQAGGTIPVHCHLANSNDPALLPGMYAKALIETRTEDVASLPAEAIVQSEGRNFIFVLADTVQNNFKFIMVPVIKGIEQEGFVAVTLPENFNISTSKVVTKGAYSVLSAMKNVEE